MFASSENPIHKPEANRLKPTDARPSVQDHAQRAKINPSDSIKILYEDDCFVVFDKPSGLLVIPTPKGETRTMMSLVNEQILRKADAPRLHPCHRLDRETSGVIIFAKGKHNQQVMMDLFKHKKVTKKYIAFVQGQLLHDAGEIKGFTKSFEQKIYRKSAPGYFSITRYKVLERRRLFSIVEVEPLTGHTNQIRLHFKGLKHPLVGDRKYAFGKDYALKFRRTALHALSIEFMHPSTKKHIKVQSPLPNDMEVFLGRN
ncbi:MAG: RluA family pseudouridine synthase [Candidatus Omnitrophica bacterium]|nr:RluA family pseudouridine synthase [Candidatus Omnitrophota bacterium]